MAGPRSWDGGVDPGAHALPTWLGLDGLESAPDGELPRLRSLWAAVVLLLIADSLNQRASGAAAIDRERARIWCKAPDGLILDAIGISPEVWREQVLPRLRRAWDAADAQPKRRGEHTLGLLKAA